MNQSVSALNLNHHGPLQRFPWFLGRDDQQYPRETILIHMSTFSFSLQVILASHRLKASLKTFKLIGLIRAWGISS